MTQHKSVDAGLKPCPFCGGENVGVYTTPFSRLWRVHCIDCEIAGEAAIDAGGAKDNWNTRAALSSARGES